VIYPGLVEPLAGGGEAVALVERHRLRLRVEDCAQVPARSREIDQRDQQRATHTASAPGREDGHPPDVAGRKQTAAADRRAFRVVRKRVRRARVHVVPFELFGHLLLDDEHRAANRAQFGRAAGPIDDAHRHTALVRHR